MNKYFTDKITHLFRRKCQTTMLNMAVCQEGLLEKLRKRAESTHNKKFTGGLFQPLSLKMTF